MMPRVADEIAALPGISSAVVVTGLYDVIADIEADNIDALGRMVLSRIQAVQAVANADVPGRAHPMRAATRRSCDRAYPPTRSSGAVTRAVDSVGSLTRC
jgi:DNA-binding Lrp family transcriptional regulator